MLPPLSYTLCFRHQAGRRRHLLASGCDALCADCTNAGTGAGGVCKKCHNNLVVLKQLPVDDPAYMTCGERVGPHSIWQ